MRAMHHTPKVKEKIESGTMSVVSQCFWVDQSDQQARGRSQVILRDQGKCTSCNSKYALQVEHIIPFAKGGTHEPKNLKLLCRNCNLQQGVKELGLLAMRR